MTVIGDAVEEADETVVLRLSGAANAVLDGGGATLDGTGTITDDDEPVRALVLSRDSLTVDEGAGASWTVALSAAPDGPVTVTIGGHAGTDLSLDAASLAFDENNWNTPRTVTVTAGRDDDAADDAATLVHSASGGYGAARAVLAVRVADDDEPAILLTPSALQLAVGQSRGYTVRLTTRPSGSVNVLIGAGDKDHMAFDRTRLDFTPSDWDEPQTVMATAKDNAPTRNGAIWT